jgi:hypothetical protein
VADQVAGGTPAQHFALRDIVKDASKLASKRKELDRLRNDHNREWAQNRAFYNNHQWTYWNNSGGRVESYGVDDGEKPRYKVRLTANQITPGVTQLVAQMTKTRPTIRAVPDSASHSDVKAAEMAERLYEYWWDEFHLKAKLQEALTHAQISQGYWLITWDPYAGKEFRVMVNPETGEPVTDDDLAGAYRDQILAVARQQGIDPQMVLGKFEQTMYLGDISIRALSGEQVWVDPVATNFEDAAYAICRYPMDVDEIKARWGVDVAPDTAVTDGRPQLIWTRSKDSRSRTAREVYCGYFRPTPSMPKGRFVCWIEGPDKILEQSDWNYPLNELPLVKFPGIQGLNTVYDTPRTTLGRPLQKELNNKISKVAEHMNLTMRPQMLAPIGSLSEQLTDEPGLVINYAPVSNQIPQWRPMPSLPQSAFEYIQDIQGRLDRLFNLMPSERSQLPARTDSGQLLDAMQEAVADQISPEIQRMEIALARAGKIMASLAQRYYIEPRMLKIRGPGGSVQVQKFINADIAGGFGFEAEAGSGLPRTRAGQVQQIKELVEMGAMSVQEAIPYLPIAGLKSLQARLARDEDYAYRKIDMLLRGEPLNVPALQEAMADVQQGVNPQTGFAFQSPEEIQKYLTDASLQPVQFENWQKSMEIIRDHMLTPEFANYDQDVQARFLQHFNALWQTVISMPNVQAPVKTTLSLRGTVGPTVGSEILRNAGIFQANPQTMSELPLDTDVRDMLGQGTHGTGEGSGNHPIEATTMMQQVAHAQDQHELNLAKAAHETTLAQTKVLQAHADVATKLHAHHADQARKDQAHQQALKLAQQRAAAQAAAAGSNSG